MNYKDDYINFHNDYEKNLFDYELSGQISDGMYENSSTDWEYWCNLETRVGTPIGRTDKHYKCRKDNYSFQKLYNYVGERMESLIKLTALNAPKNILQHASYGYFSRFPDYLGEYDEDEHVELLRSGERPEYKIYLDDKEMELFEWLEEEFGKEEMYEKWNRCPRPSYKEVLKGVRECMKTPLTQNQIEEIKRKELQDKLNNGIQLTKEEKRDELKKHIVRTVLTDGRVRVEANDGKHGRHFVSFPKDLRSTENLFYYVEKELRWNGKNYLATKSDGIREATPEEIKLLMLK